MIEKILIFCAHNDDHLFGLGGTIANYLREKKKVKIVIMTTGEQSNPILKKREGIKVRNDECKKGDEILGNPETEVLGLADLHLEKLLKRKSSQNKIADIIKSYNPDKIFIHGEDDPHPDHRAINKAVLEVVDKIDYKKSVYTFDVWNPIRIRKRTEPKLVIDTSKTFKLKIKALKCHQSQKIVLLMLLWNVYTKDFLNGLGNNCKFAEVFHKAR